MLMPYVHEFREPSIVPNYSIRPRQAPTPKHVKAIPRLGGCASASSERGTPFAHATHGVSKSRPWSYNLRDASWYHKLCRYDGHIDNRCGYMCRLDGSVQVEHIRGACCGTGGRVIRLDHALPDHDLKDAPFASTLSLNWVIWPFGMASSGRCHSRYFSDALRDG